MPARGASEENAMSARRDALTTMSSGAVTSRKGRSRAGPPGARAAILTKPRIGPFCFRVDDGRARCAFQPRREHLNGGGTIHGGALMSFADFSLFAIAHNALAGAARGDADVQQRIHRRRRTWTASVEAEGEVIARHALCHLRARACHTSFTPIACIFRHAQEDRAARIARGFEGVRPCVRQDRRSICARRCRKNCAQRSKNLNSIRRRTEGGASAAACA